VGRAGSKVSPPGVGFLKGVMLPTDISFGAGHNPPRVQIAVFELAISEPTHYLQRTAMNRAVTSSIGVHAQHTDMHNGAYIRSTSTMVNCNIYVTFHALPPEKKMNTKPLSQ
jgi:hypothetical protein